jgi:hypothetical protein
MLQSRSVLAAATVKRAAADQRCPIMSSEGVRFRISLNVPVGRNRDIKMALGEYTFELRMPPITDL